MESTLYQSIFEKGEAGVYGETIIRLPSYRLGPLDPVTRERIRKVSDPETLKLWHEESLFLGDAEGAQRLAEKIRNAPLPWSGRLDSLGLKDDDTRTQLCEADRTP